MKNSKNVRVPNIEGWSLSLSLNHFTVHLSSKFEYDRSSIIPFYFFVRDLGARTRGVGARVVQDPPERREAWGRGVRIIVLSA
jgi:hypothetical protein